MSVLNLNKKTFNNFVDNERSQIYDPDIIIESDLSLINQNEIVGIKPRNIYEIPSEISKIDIFFKFEEICATVDTFILLLDKDSKVSKDEDVIFYNQLSNLNKSVLMYGESDIDEKWTDIFQIDFSKIEDRVNEILIVCSIYEKNKTFKEIKSILCQIKSVGKVLFNYKMNEPSSFENNKGIILFSIKRKDNYWQLSEKLVAYENGIDHILNLYLKYYID